ncbi:hypothetical protein ACFQ9X_09120 [Catenulispora yoronensis]
MDADADTEDFDDDEDLLLSYLAQCPITDATAATLAAAAQIDLTKVDEADRALVGLGFLKDGIEVDGAWYRLPEGHLVYGDYTVAVPFAYSYGLGGELNPEDYWGTLPGWSSAEEEPDQFRSLIEDAVQAFTRALGAPPERDGRTRQPFANRIAAWRVGGNVLIVSEGKEPYSYWQDDQALVIITAAPGDPGDPLPEDVNDMERLRNY